MKKHVIIMGSRGFTKRYGGWETLVRGMLDNWNDNSTQFYVTEVTTDKSEPEFENVRGINCIRVYTKQKRAAQMLVADTKVLINIPKYIKHYHVENPILYVLGVRNGFLFWLRKRMLNKYNITIINNSDGMAWKRGKYGFLQKSYGLMSRYFFDKYVMDYLVADAREMQRIYVEEKLVKRKHPCESTVIYYGTNEAPILPAYMPSKVSEFFDKNEIIEGKYYLIINRFVPENSYEMILREFIKSTTPCDFIVVTNQDKEHAFYKKLKETIPFEKDKRIKFVGTVYDDEILAWLRQKARGYINGHTVGGTNPGLLEALATTDVNLVRDCPFSREGAGDTAFYFDEEHPLSELLLKVDAMTVEERKEMGSRAKARMKEKFNWADVVEQYAELFNYIAKKNKEKQR